MEILIALLGSSVINGVLMYVLNRRKTNSETELNEIKAMQILLQEERDFYALRISVMDTDIRAALERVQLVESRYDCLLDKFIEVQKELLELRGKKLE